MIIIVQGPVLGWIHALQCYRECGLDLPVNFKFCFEGNKLLINQLINQNNNSGMEESGSEGLDKMLMSRQDTRFMQEVESCSG